MNDARAVELQEQIRSVLPDNFMRDDKSGLSLQLVIQGRTDQEVALQAALSLIQGMDGKLFKILADIQSPSLKQPYQVRYCFMSINVFSYEYNVVSRFA